MQKLWSKKVIEEFLSNSFFPTSVHFFYLLMELNRKCMNISDRNTFSDITDTFKEKNLGGGLSKFIAFSIQSKLNCDALQFKIRYIENFLIELAIID